MREAVARYGDCLQQLPRRQRRVLRMRAGVGPRDPASRAVVARRLDLTVARVRRVEHRALRALRRGCGDGAAQPASDGASASASARAGTVFVDEPPAAAADPGAPDGGAANGAGGEGKGGRGGVKGTSATALPAPAPGRDDPPVLIIVALVAGGLGWYAFTRLRERYYGGY